MTGKKIHNRFDSALLLTYNSIMGKQIKKNIPSLVLILMALALVGCYLVLVVYQTSIYKDHIRQEQRNELIQLATLARNVMEPVVVRYRKGELTKKQALGEIRNLGRSMIFSDSNGQNYIFMAAYDGTNLVQPFHPENELTNMWFFQDTRGNYVLQNLVKIARDNPNGGFYDYWLNLPGQKDDQRKTAFVIGIPELDCYLGAGIYLDSYRKQQNRILLIIIGSSVLLILFVSALVTVSIALILRQNRLLSDSETKFRTLFENMTEGVALHEVLVDDNDIPTDYRLVDMNPAYTRQTGIELEKVRGKTSREAYGTDTPPYLKEFCDVAMTRAPYHFDTYFPPLERHFSISVISPKKYSFATVFEDVTDQKKREEELRQKNDELVRFTYTVSHDLRSPLVTINAFLGYLEDDLKKKDQSRIDTDFVYIRTAVAKMGTLLDELLKLSRIGRQSNSTELFTLQEVAGEALKLAGGRLAQNGVTVTVTDVPLTLRGDKPRITEVFQNLLDNAAKFRSRNEKPVVEIFHEKIDDNRVIKIRDNGIGIDPRHKKRLFGLFEKLNPEIDGSGMGLALARRIVEIHGGRIWAESEGPDKGTTFCFTLGGLK
jgi:signal transduction histidine kinase